MRYEPPKGNEPGHFLAADSNGNILPTQPSAQHGDCGPAAIRAAFGEKETIQQIREKMASGYMNDPIGAFWGK